MTQKVSVADARNHLTVLLRDVERGQHIDLTRRGKSIAVLISQAEYRRLCGTGRSAAEALRTWREQAPEGFEGLTDEDLSSLRDRDAGRDVRF